MSTYRDTDSLHGWGEDDAAELDRLRELFGSWRFWRGQTPKGEPVGWYATRLGRLSNEQLSMGLCMTLDAESSDQLQTAVAQQIDLARVPTP